MAIRRAVWTVLLIALTLAACAPAAPGVSVAPEQPVAPVPRTLIIAISREPASLADKTLARTGSGIGADTGRFFNAGLAIRDESDAPHPYLAEALPQLNTANWRVLADGRMETTFRLRPNLTWHDGVPLTAADFVFGWRVYTVPEYGYADSVPIAQMEEVVAHDERTVLIRWRLPYPGAPQIVGEEFAPLPRHALEGAFQVGEPEGFIGHGYWAEEHVGLGPYRLERWERGAFIEGSGFETHALGPPRIARLKMVFLTDSNTVVANLLAGAVHTTDDRALRFQQGLVLKQEFAARQTGTVLFYATDARWTLAQFKPEFANPPLLLDLRVRKGLIHALDRQALADGLLDGQGLPADTLVVPKVEYFPALERVLTKYPVDLRRTDQYLREAGLEKGSDGFYASPGQGRFSLQIAVSALAQNEAEAAIMADSFRRAGIDTSIHVLSQAQATDRQVRSSFPGLSSTSNTNAFEIPVNFLRASQIPTPENRWRGSNRGGWIHPDFERLAAAYDTTLERSERNQRGVEMLRIVSEELPGFPLYYNFHVLAHLASLQGPREGANWNWNVHEWELR